MPSENVFELVAGAVAFRRDEDLECEYLVAADPEAGGRTFELQLGLADDDSERSLGLIGHCVVLDGGATAYGCIGRWELDGSTLLLVFSDSGRRELGFGSARIELPSESVAVVRKAVGHLVDGGPPITDFTIQRAP